MWNTNDLPACSAGDEAQTNPPVTWSPGHLVMIVALVLAALEASPGHAQPPVAPPARGSTEEPLPPLRPTPSTPAKRLGTDEEAVRGRPSQKSPLEISPSPSGEVVDLKPAPLEPGDLCFPINLATALRLADARPIIVFAAGASAWTAEAELQKAKVLWVPTLNLGFDYIRHDGPGPDLNNGLNIPQGVNALGQNSPGNLGKPINQNINFFYGGAGLSMFAYTPNFLFQPTFTEPMLPTPIQQFMTDMIFEPLKQRQNLNTARWNIQTAKNDALFMTATAYFNVHRFRGQYTGAIDAVVKGRKLIAEIDELSRDLVPKVEIDRARNLLADLEQQAVAARQAWRVASAQLTQVLRLDPRAVVAPLEHDHVQITLIDPSRSLDDLIPIGLTNRPELAAHQAQIQAMLVSIRQEKLRPLLPAVLLNGFQTPDELLQGGVEGIGNGGKMNNWGSRDDFTPQLLWEADGVGLKNLARVKEQRGRTSQEMVKLFQMQDMVAGDITRAQADLQSWAAQVVQAERELRGALVNFNGNVEGLRQTKRFGNILVQVFRPQEAVFALQLVKLAYDNYFNTVAQYNIAQFELFHALGYPAQEIASKYRTGEILPVDTSRPAYLPPVGTGPPPATR
jgi:hypothetical protein